VYTVPPAQSDLTPALRFCAPSLAAGAASDTGEECVNGAMRRVNQSAAAGWAASVWADAVLCATAMVRGDCESSKDAVEVSIDVNRVLGCYHKVWPETQGIG